MTDLDKIVTVIKKHHLMTLATCTLNPWVAHVFYAWVPRLGCFVFTSDPATRHGTEMTANPCVAGGIALETRIVGRVQGIQIEGSVRKPDSTPDNRPAASGSTLATTPASTLTTELTLARNAYLKRFPYAAVVDLNLWLLEPSSMKLTDNTLGFGTKLVWKK